MAPRIDTSTIPQLPPVQDSMNREEGRFPHTQFNYSVIDYRHEGKLQIPVSGPPGTKCVFAELHAPYGVRVVSWIAFRDGKIPILPDFETSDANEVLLDVIIGTCEPKVIDGVRFEFSVTGQAKYGLYLPSDKKTGYQMGASVLSTNPAMMNVIRENNFTKHTRGK